MELKSWRWLLTYLLTFWWWNKLFDKTTFLMQQTFWQNKLFDKTIFLTKHTFWWNKVFDKTNFEKKQTLLLIYYSDYWNLKFLIDSFLYHSKIFYFLQCRLSKSMVWLFQSKMLRWILTLSLHIHWYKEKKFFWQYWIHQE